MSYVFSILFLFSVLIICPKAFCQNAVATKAPAVLSERNLKKLKEYRYEYRAPEGSVALMSTERISDPQVINRIEINGTTEAYTAFSTTSSGISVSEGVSKYFSTDYGNAKVCALVDHNFRAGIKATAAVPIGESKQIFASVKASRSIYSDRIGLQAQVGYEQVVSDRTKFTLAVEKEGTKIEIPRVELRVTSKFGLDDNSIIADAYKMISWPAVVNVYNTRERKQDKYWVEGYVALIESYLRFADDVESGKIPDKNLSDMMIVNNDNNGKYLSKTFNTDMVGECRTEIALSAKKQALALYLQLNKQLPMLTARPKEVRERYQQKLFTAMGSRDIKNSCLIGDKQLALQNTSKKMAKTIK